MNLQVEREVLKNLVVGRCGQKDRPNLMEKMMNTRLELPQTVSLLIFSDHIDESNPNIEQKSFMETGLDILESKCEV